MSTFESLVQTRLGGCPARLCRGPRRLPCPRRTQLGRQVRTDAPRYGAGARRHPDRRPDRRTERAPKVSAAQPLAPGADALHPRRSSRSSRRGDTDPQVAAGEGKTKLVCATCDAAVPFRRPPGSAGAARTASAARSIAANARRQSEPPSPVHGEAPCPHRGQAKGRARASCPRPPFRNRSRSAEQDRACVGQSSRKTGDVQVLNEGAGPAADAARGVVVRRPWAGAEPAAEKSPAPICPDRHAAEVRADADAATSHSPVFSPSKGGSVRLRSVASSAPATFGGFARLPVDEIGRESTVLAAASGLGAVAAADEHRLARRNSTVSCVPAATPETSTRSWLAGADVGRRVHLVEERPDGRPGRHRARPPAVAKYRKSRRSSLKISICAMGQMPLLVLGSGMEGGLGKLSAPPGWCDLPGAGFEPAGERKYSLTYARIGAGPPPSSYRRKAAVRAVRRLTARRRAPDPKEGSNQRHDQPDLPGAHGPPIEAVCETCRGCSHH